MREQAGLIEAKRLQDTKVRVQKQIELKRKVKTRTLKKVAKPLIEDTELTKLRGEKLKQQNVLMLRNMQMNY
jgi:hypothetical protein